jgi:O-antigen biosynthesis protein WbqP
MHYRFLKRSFDLVFSLILFIIFIPLWIIIPVLIKADSPGRVIFTQKRVGLNGNYFKIYKFRTMKEGTPDIPTNKVRNQEDMNTRLGTALRRSSIDEIPQLYNIFKGEMSFVGPRPALHNQPRLIGLRKKKGVDMIRPGVTGLAQVSGRDNLTIPKKVEYDLQYVKEMSFWVDLRILFVTVKAVLSGKGGN